MSSDAHPEFTDNKLEQPIERFPNRARAQTLLPIPNASSRVPGKNRKRRIVKIAIGDEGPLELNHSLDGLTIPAQPSVDGNVINGNIEESKLERHSLDANVTNGIAEESKLEQQKERIREENHKQNHPTIPISNTSSPTVDELVSSSLTSPPSSSAGKPPPIITVPQSIIKSSKGASSTPNTPTHGVAAGLHPLTKSSKGVSFPHEDKHHPPIDLSNLASKEQLFGERNPSQKEGISSEYTPAEIAKMETVVEALKITKRGPSGKSLTLTSRTSTIGRQMSTIRLKEGYHHYRKSDSVVVEIGDEHYYEAEPFIYDAAYSQEDRDEKGNKIGNKKTTLDLGRNVLENVGMSSKGQRKQSNNKPASEKSSVHKTSTTYKQLYNIFTCRSGLNAVFGAERMEEKRDEMIAKAQADEHDDELNYPLFYWIKNKDLDQVKRVLKEKRNATNVYVSQDGTFDTQEECLGQDKAEVIKRDAAGATVFHIAYLFEQYEIARYLVQQYPSEALLPYDGDCKLFDSETGKIILEVEKNDMMYSGENILHIAIIKRNIPETRWLLEFYNDKEHAIHYGLIRLLTANAVGTFFRPCKKDNNTSFYFGGFPLLFAVSCGNQTMFDLVLAYASSIPQVEKMAEEQEAIMFSYRLKAKYDYVTVTGHEGRTIQKYVPTAPWKDRFADCSIYTQWELKVAQYARRFLGSNVIFLRDIYGNNALHLCVQHNLQSMFKEVSDRAERLLAIEIRDTRSKFLQHARISKMREKDYEGKYIFYLPELAENCFGYSPKESFLTMPMQSQFDNWIGAVVKKKLEERFMMVLNEDLHSPLTLAAAMPDPRDPDDDPHDQSPEKKMKKEKKKTMLQFLLRKLHTMRWEYGPVRRNLVDLAGVEMSFDKQKYPRLKADYEKRIKTPTMKGAITWLCETKSDDCIMIEEVQRFIELKWKRCGYNLFLQALLAHAIMTLTLTVLVCLVNATPHYNNQPDEDYLSRIDIQSLVTPLNLTATNPITNQQSNIPARVFAFLDIDQAVSVLYIIVVFQMVLMLVRDLWASFVHFYFYYEGNVLYCPDEYTRVKKSHPFFEPEHDNVRGTYGKERTYAELIIEWLYAFFVSPHTAWSFLFAPFARGAAWFNLFTRYLISVSFGIHCLFKYLASRQGDRDIYFGDDDTIRRYWHDDFDGSNFLDHNGALHVFYRPVNDMRVLLPLVVCIIVAWIRSFFFLMGFETTGPIVLIINKIITNNVPRFLFYFFIIVLALACGVCMLINSGDPSVYVGFYDLLKSFWVLLKLTFNNNIQNTAGDFGLDPNSVPHNDYVLFDVLYTLFFFMVMIMINLLIAIMGETYQRFKKDSKSLLMMEKYNIMTYFEGFMISKTKYRENYTVHKSDVRMPQGWKEYTGEKTELDRWETIRNAFTSKSWRDISDTSVTGLQDDTKPKIVTPRSSIKASGTSETMMFYEESGEVKTKRAPPEVLAEVSRSNGAYTGESTASNKSSRNNRFSGNFLSKDLKDRPQVGYEVQEVDKTWFGKVTKESQEDNPKVVLLIVDPQVDFHCNENRIEITISSMTVTKSPAATSGKEKWGKVSDGVAGGYFNNAEVKKAQINENDEVYIKLKLGPNGMEFKTKNMPYNAIGRKFEKKEEKKEDENLKILMKWETTVPSWSPSTENMTEREKEKEDKRVKDRGDLLGTLKWSIWKAKKPDPNAKKRPNNDKEEKKEKPVGSGETVLPLAEYMYRVRPEPDEDTVIQDKNFCNEPYEPEAPAKFPYKDEHDVTLGSVEINFEVKLVKPGSLAVPGADEDSERIAHMICGNMDNIDDIYVTMDTHHKLHMAHAKSWTRGAFKLKDRTKKKDGKKYEIGDHPEPYTTITYLDIHDGIWVPGPHLDGGWCQEYAKKLEASSKFCLQIWPEHCLIGTTGHAVVPVISEALTEWSRRRRKTVNYICVGQNIRTEVYSVFKAEVEDPAEAKDQSSSTFKSSSTFNHHLMLKLKIADKLLVCGQALSHCVNFTCRDLVAHFAKTEKLYILKDGCSCVEGFEDNGKQFLYDMEKSGVNVVTTEVVFRLIYRKHVATHSNGGGYHNHAGNATASGRGDNNDSGGTGKHQADKSAHPSLNDNPAVLRSEMVKFENEMLEHVKETIERALGRKSTKGGSSFSMSTKGGGKHSSSAPSGLKISVKDQFTATEGRTSGRERRARSTPIDFTINEDGRRLSNNTEDDEHSIVSTPVLSPRDSKISSLEQQLQKALQENDILRGLLTSSNPNNR